ncbi:MAG: crossover junction endodeoxyribonuclease RuvC [Desulfosudis oleivorans]|nr:crossover junction endodeoxyribonuclease RuvC [Desulfosudis oleivorans]
MASSSRRAAGLVRVDARRDPAIKNGEPFTGCSPGSIDELTEVIGRTKPDAVAIEDIFYGKNVKSLIKQGHVRGVALLAGADSGLPVHEYSPARGQEGRRRLRPGRKAAGPDDGPGDPETGRDCCRRRCGRRPGRRHLPTNTRERS